MRRSGSSHSLRIHIYGVAAVSRLLKMIGLFCRISSLLWGSFAKKRPTILRSLLVVATPYIYMSGATPATPSCLRGHRARS